MAPPTRSGGFLGGAGGGMLGTIAATAAGVAAGSFLFGSLAEAQGLSLQRLAPTFVASR